MKSPSERRFSSVERAGMILLFAYGLVWMLIGIACFIKIAFF